MKDIISTILSQPDIAKIIIILLTIIILTSIILVFFIIKNFHEIKTKYFHLKGNSGDNDSPNDKSKMASYNPDHINIMDNMLELLKKQGSDSKSTFSLLAKIFRDDNILVVESDTFVELMIKKATIWCKIDDTDLDLVTSLVFYTIANISKERSYNDGQKFIKENAISIIPENKKFLREALKTAIHIIDNHPSYTCYD